MPWPQTGATQYHGLPDKGHAIKGLVVCINWDLEPLDLLNGLSLECYRPFPEVLIVLSLILSRTMSLRLSDFQVIYLLVIVLGNFFPKR